MEKVQKNKSINFEEYVDRDVPYLKNQSFAKSDSSGKGAKEFDTKL